MCKDKYPRDRPASGLHTRNWHTQEISKVMSSVSRKWTWAQTSVEGDQVEDVDVGHIVATVDIDGLYQPDAHPYPHQDEVVTQQKDAPEEPHAQDWNTNGELLMKKQKKVHKLLHEYYTCIKFGTFKELHLKSCWFILIHPQWKTTSESWVKCDTSVLIKKKKQQRFGFVSFRFFSHLHTTKLQTIRRSVRNWIQAGHHYPSQRLICILFSVQLLAFHCCMTAMTWALSLPWTCFLLYYLCLLQLTFSCKCSLFVSLLNHVKGTEAKRDGECQKQHLP